jgi:hypothetical protein
MGPLGVWRWSETLASKAIEVKGDTVSVNAVQKNNSIALEPKLDASIDTASTIRFSFSHKSEGKAYGMVGLVPAFSLKENPRMNKKVRRECICIFLFLALLLTHAHKYASTHTHTHTHTHTLSLSHTRTQGKAKPTISQKLSTGFIGDKVMRGCSLFVYNKWTAYKCGKSKVLTHESARKSKRGNCTVTLTYSPSPEVRVWCMQIHVTCAVLSLSLSLSHTHTYTGGHIECHERRRRPGGCSLGAQEAGVSLGCDTVRRGNHGALSVCVSV